VKTEMNIWVLQKMGYAYIDNRTVTGVSRRTLFMVWVRKSVTISHVFATYSVFSVLCQAVEVLEIKTKTPVKTETH